jgi:putative FmdB family regulatory protein
VPTYDYQCDACSHQFEARQRISAEPLTECPSCRGPVRRLIAPAPFILKGRGWYVTDYPSETRKKGLEAEKSASTPSGSNGGTAAPAPAPAPSTSAPPAPAPASSS